MNTYIKLIVGIAVVALIGVGVWFVTKDGTVTPSSPVTPTPVVNTINTSASSTASYTLADVALHNSAASCWTAVNGKVYDITVFIPDHPGGKEILKACGKDGTRLFESQDEHVEQNAQGTLNAFFIGNLK